MNQFLAVARTNLEAAAKQMLDEGKYSEVRSVTHLLEEIQSNFPEPESLSLTENEKNYVNRGLKIDAIKLLRSRHPQLSLKEAKDVVDDYLRAHAVVGATSILSY